MSKKIKLMADYHSWPLWWVVDDGLINLDPKELSLPQNIAARLDVWTEKYDAQLNFDESSESSFLKNTSLEMFTEEGIKLWKLLIGSLSAEEYEVHFFHPILRKTLKHVIELE